MGTQRDCSVGSSLAILTEGTTTLRSLIASTVVLFFPLPTFRGLLVQVDELLVNPLFQAHCCLLARLHTLEVVHMLLRLHYSTSPFTPVVVASKTSTDFIAMNCQSPRFIIRVTI